MSRQADSVFMKHHLNINYWEGHTLGIGDMEPPTGVSYSSRESNFARNTLEERVRPDHDMMLLETFKPGQQFEPAEYAPGTVALMRREYVYGPLVQNDYDLDELTSKSIWPIAATVSPSFYPNAPHSAGSDGKRHYSSSVCWGVVPADRQPGKLSIVSALFVVKRGGAIRVGSPFTTKNQIPVIGEVKHTRSQFGAPERLQRIHILHVVAYGQAERKRARIFDLAGKLATRLG